jgi:hypothetical protein
MPVPRSPKIYHITHVENLRGILANGGLFSDAEMRARGGPSATIGMSHIKERRLSLPVPCHPGSYVGEYVPFYFCPRSIMLYLIFRGNQRDLAFREGQDAVVHLEADLWETAARAGQTGRRWAFSLSNAGAYYAEFRDRLDQFDDLDWPSIEATDFRAVRVRERKQAEFLVHGFFPWSLVRRIGVISLPLLDRVTQVLADIPNPPAVEIRRDWYY